MAGISFTINFDTGIEKVEYGASQDNFPQGEANSSGQTVTQSTFDFYVRPIFKQGYELDTTNVSQTANPGIYVCVDEGGKPVYNITFTSKQSASSPTFKHFFNSGTIGSGTIKFRHFSQTEPLPQLATPQNVAVNGTTLSWDAVENATSYDIYAYGTLIGNTTGQPAAYTDCLTFTGEASEFTLSIGSGGTKEWDGTVYYSTDHNTWTVWDGTAITSVGKKLYLRGKNNTTFYTSDGARLSLSARAGCSGNIQTLLDYENPPTVIGSSNCYNSMFWKCTNLTTAPELPATTLAAACYARMFETCSSLATAPALPATTLEQSCYFQMFYGCTSLATAPALPATTLAEHCYNGMFYNCTSLTTVSDLPATTLAEWCYNSMFQNCTSLTTAPKLFATTFAISCCRHMFFGCTLLKISDTTGTKIFTCPSNIPSGAVSDMFYDTGGSFTGTPTAGNTYYWYESYERT